MRLIDQFHNEGSDDAYAFVFDTQQDGLNDILMLGEDGFQHGHWTRGPYDPDGENDHLGQRVMLHELGATILNAFFYRLSIPEGYEELVEELAQAIESDDSDENADDDEAEEDEDNEDEFDLSDALRRLDQFRIQQRDATAPPGAVKPDEDE